MIQAIEPCGDPVRARFEHRQAFLPRGTYGGWIARQNAELALAERNDALDRLERERELAAEADVTGLPVRIPTNVETTATGAAMLAGVAAGLFDTVAEASSSFVSFRPEGFEPDSERHAIYNDMYALYRRVYWSLRDVFAASGEEEVGSDA